MELLVPGFALASLYYVNNKNKKTEEGFSQKEDLPNVNLRDKNYPSEQKPMFLGETALDDVYKTSQLSKVNKYNNTGTFTDKYYQPNQKESASETINNSLDDCYKPEYKSMSGQTVGKEYFKHNNMVPFFGSKPKGQIKEQGYDSILDNYIGNGSQQIKKSEQSPMFAPQENVQWAYGTPNNNDFMMSRVNPSMRRANEKPFESIQDAPGLTNDGKFAGYNAGQMGRDEWQPKTVDELRVLTNQKAGGISLLNHEGPGVSQVKNMGKLGIQEKNRPERMYENTPDRWFTTTGAEQGRTMRAEPILRVVNRPETTTDYTGAAVSQVEGEYVPGEYMASTNIHLGEKPLGVPSASGNNNPQSGEYGLNSKKAYPNNRSENEQPNFFGAAGTAVSAAVSPLIDILRPSRKENVIGNLRPYQNPGSTVPETYMFNPNDRTKTTHRETTENSKQNGYINSNQNGGAYKTTEHQVAFTNRNVTGDFLYSGNANGNREMKSNVAELNQRNNDLKSSTIKGRMQAGNMSLYNGDINMTQRNRDHMLKNNRQISANRGGIGSIPDANTFGQLSGKDNSLYQTINMDRNNAELLNALKSNPYVTNYKNAL
tara:strand:+ start:1854 stop:3653 length:1800 start_codon:yes stop_codon:yes gene_type:complete